MAGTPATGQARLSGYLTMPHRARGIVVFAHGSGRHSPRNRYTARVLNQAGPGTLLLDLLTPAEEANRPTCSTSRSSPAASPK